MNNLKKPLFIAMSNRISSGVRYVPSVFLDNTAIHQFEVMQTFCMTQYQKIT